MSTTLSPVLDQLLKPVTSCFTREVAEALANLHVDPETQARLDEFARKSTEGKLSDKEKAEYATYVTAIDLIGILQSKARKQLGT